MTHPEAQRLLDLIRGTWSQADWTEQMIAAWLQRLPGLPHDDARLAYERLLNRGSAFTPSLAEFAAAAAEAKQGPAPTPEQVDEILRRNASKWPYRGHVTAREHTVAAVSQLMAVGAHEAVCRFVEQVGGREAAEMPDASAGLGRDQQIRRHELLRTYREQSVASWRTDPTPGLALRSAQAVAPAGLGRLDPLAALDASQRAALEQAA